MKKLTYESALKVFYGLINADGMASEEEINKLDELGLSLENELGENLFENGKEKIVYQFSEEVKEVSKEKYQDFLLDWMDNALFAQENDVQNDELRIITPRWLIWNMLVLAYKDGEYHKNEKALIAYIAEVTNQDSSVLPEMENYIRAYYAVDNELYIVIENDGPYSVVRPIVDELEQRKTFIIENAIQLINDENEEIIQAIEVKKNFYSRTIDIVKEKMSPITDVVEKKTEEIYSGAKEKVMYSPAAPVIKNIEEKTTDLVGDVKEKTDDLIGGVKEKTSTFANEVKQKTKDLDLGKKVGNLFKKK